MRQKIEPNVGYGLRGWKARQEAAKRKMSRGANAAERERVREIRKRHREALETPEKAPEVSEPPIVVPEQEPVEEMGRDALMAELQAAGQTVHPASKDGTLRRKVEELRNG